jgi:hypothetical protein
MAPDRRSPRGSPPFIYDRCDTPHVFTTVDPETRCHVATARARPFTNAVPGHEGSPPFIYDTGDT